MRLLAFASLLSIAFNAAALTPPPPGQVSDEDAVRLLKTAYANEPVGLAGEWSAKYRMPDEDAAEPVAVTRSICADSGREAYGPRMIAVCTAFDDAGHVTPGLVDLWLLLDAREGQPARVGASKRDIQTGGFGTPGDVGFFAVGPARTAFALDSGYSNMGWSSSIRTLYFAESDRFEELLSVGTVLDNGGSCGMLEDEDCRKTWLALSCSLQAETANAPQGFYPLRVEVKGERHGKRADRSIPIPFENGAYRVPTQTLVRQGCDQGL